MAVTGVNVADATFGDSDEWFFVDAVLSGEVEEVESAAKDVGLVACFAVDADDSAVFEGAVGGPELFNDADFVVGDVAEAYEPDEKGQGDEADGED